MVVESGTNIDEIKKPLNVIDDYAGLWRSISILKDFDDGAQFSTLSVSHKGLWTDYFHEGELTLFGKVCCD